MRAATSIVLGATAWLLLGSCAGGPIPDDKKMLPLPPLSRDVLDIKPLEGTPPEIEGYGAYQRRIANGAVAAPRHLPEELLLDVGIAVFQMHGDDDEASGGELAEVRRVEGKYLPNVLKKTLQHTGHWGAVRVVPRASAAVDVAVVAVVERIDGDALALRARVMDVRGTTWFERRYPATGNVAARQPGGPEDVPFEAALAALANDMTRHLHGLPSEELARIRTVGALRFADSLVPGAFARYLAENEHGEAEPVRLPATNDPLFASIQRIRHREHLFIDTVDEYFEQFSADIAWRYRDWQREVRDSAVAARDLRRQAQSERLLGATSIVAGLALVDAEATANRAALASVASGVGLVRAALRKDDEISSGAEQLRYGGERAGAEMLPYAVALENQTGALERDVDAHYDNLRRILRSDYEDERGQAPPQAPPAALGHFAPLAPPNAGAKGLSQTPRRANAALAALPPEPPPLSGAVQEGLDVAAEEIRRRRLAAAFDTLHGLLEDADRLNSRELGEINALLGIAHFDAGNLDASATAFETVATVADALPRERAVATYYNLMGVYVRAENHSAAANAMRRALAESSVLNTACATVCTAAPLDSVDRKKRSRSDRISQSVFLRLANARQLGRIDAEAAAADLRDLLYHAQRGLSDLNETELAYSHDVLAALYLQLHDFDRAKESLEQVAARIAVIPQGRGTAALYRLAQLHFEAGHYEQSMRYQERWLARSELVERACPVVCGEDAGHATMKFGRQMSRLHGKSGR